MYLEPSSLLVVFGGVNLTTIFQVSGENSLETDVQTINNFPLPLSYNHLSPLVDKDKEYLDELSQLNSIITQVNINASLPVSVENANLTVLFTILAQILDKAKKDKIPRIYWVRLPHLGDVSELHDPYSDSTVEAKKLLTKSLVELTDKIKNTYGDKVSFELPIFEYTFLNLFSMSFPA